MSDTHDRNVDTVLQALRQAEPDPAMQARLLAALRDARMGQGGREGAWQWWRAAGTGALLPWLAAAALLLGVGGTLLLHQGSSAGAKSGPLARVFPHGDGAMPGSESASLEVPRLKSETWGTPQARRLATRVPAYQADALTPTRMPHIPERSGTELPAIHQAAPAETGRGLSAGLGQAQSIPPPPLPLTEQERMLLRFAHREPATQLAELSASAQNAVFQHEKDRVTEFFAPPPTPEQDFSPYESPTGQQ